MEKNFGSMSLQELCEDISISAATGKNWLKSGKIKPQYTEGNRPYFSREYAERLKRDIRSGAIASLKSRRNKKYISGNVLYTSYISDTSANVAPVSDLIARLAEGETEVREEELRFLLAECAIQLFLSNGKFLRISMCSGYRQGLRSFLTDYLDGRITLGIYGTLIDDLIGDYDRARQFAKARKALFTYRYFYEEGEDVLGFLYLSGKNIAGRKAAGAYYTPVKAVKHLVAKICEKETDAVSKKILDPCCGTGNFLMQLPENFIIENIFGNDIDEISVQITRINLALKYRPDDIGILYKNVTCLDYLSEYEAGEFDYIIGNPPWGYRFSEEEKERLRYDYKSAKGRSIEAYDLFTEKALAGLKKGGSLSFVLPEAILNVRVHMPVREIIMEKSSVRYLAYLGNVFDNVQCPCIILQLQHTGKRLSCAGMEVNDGKRVFIIHRERKATGEYFCFKTTDEEQELLEKLAGNPNCITLEGKASFALGIVTGDNRTFLSETKKVHSEPVLKGADIYKYRVRPASRYLVFSQENFQQTAPEEYYRAPEKLLYRFICNQLVFAYDDRQTLSLNSCNIVIPHVEGMSVKYIMAILNSRIAQFFFDKSFGSVKVLRSHIERIPIPKASHKRQKEIVLLAERIMEAQTEAQIQHLYDELDRKAASLFDLSEREYMIMKNAAAASNLFLF